MIYLSGCVRPETMLGVMLTPMMGNALPDGVLWAADTGCFAAPEKHDDSRYLDWLEQRGHARGRCLLATAPDVVGDAEQTLTRSLPMLTRIRAIDFPAALVAQDGLEHLTIPWDEFDALFVGGTTAWKLSEVTYDLVREAKQRGKWCHMGRVNSLRRLKAAQVGGYDSADGTFLAFGPDKNLPRLQGWMEKVQLQPRLLG